MTKGTAPRDSIMRVFFALLPAIDNDDDGNDGDLSTSHRCPAHFLQVVVTCIQSGMHGKGDFAMDSKKTSDSDQWHFVPGHHWLGCKPVDCSGFDSQVRC